MHIKHRFLTLALATGLAVLPAAAQGRRHFGQGFHGGFAAGRMAAALELTEAQKQFAKDLREQNRQQTEALRKQLKENREALKEAVQANNTSQIQSLTATQGELMGKLAAIQAESRAKFYAQLTPEQKQKAEELQAKWKEHRAERKNRATQ